MVSGCISTRTCCRPRSCPRSIRLSRVDRCFEEAIALLAPLARHPKALGFELTIYDPSLDPTRESARTLVGLLARAFRG